MIPELPRNSLIQDGKAGDFDLLVFNHTFPNRIVCFEFKMIKITALDIETDRINKIQGVSKLINQINDRINLGFHAVYGVIVIQADLRERHWPNTIMKPFTSIFFEQLNFELTKDVSLNDRAGIIFIKYIQPNGRNVTFASNFAVYLKKKVKPQEQKQSLTSDFNILLKKISNCD